MVTLLSNISLAKRLSAQRLVIIAGLVIIAASFFIFPQNNNKNSNFGMVGKGKEKTNYVWPVDGEVISNFGDPRKTWHNGIDIDLPEGTPIYAAADGEVVYAGEQSNVYGLMILLSHSDGSITMYAHNSKNKVKNDKNDKNDKKERVKRGELIGWVGKSGDADVPKLHFSIFGKDEVLDPLEYLPKQKVVSNSTKYNWPVNADIFSKSGEQIVKRIENTKAVTGRISLEINEQQPTRHWGIDIETSENTPVVAAADGQIDSVMKFEGKWKIVVKHSNGIFTAYTPISAKSVMQVGTKVKRGERIAFVGDVDSDTIPHLHFEIQKKGEFLDPFGKGFLVPKTQKAISAATTKTVEPECKVPGTYMWPIQSKIYPDRESFNGGKGGKAGFISSRFMDDRPHGQHSGIDIAIGDGEPVYAAGASSGEVTFLGCDSKCEVCDDTCRKGAGKYIVITHDDGSETMYAHLQEFNEKIALGNKVKPGDPIGLVGHTGTCRSSVGGTGAHLHFEIRMRSKLVNPMSCLPRIK